MGHIEAPDDSPPVVPLQSDITPKIVTDETDILFQAATEAGASKTEAKAADMTVAAEHQAAH